MKDLRLKQWEKLPFKDPEEYLKRLRSLQESVTMSAATARIKALRTHKLKTHRERWHSALFAYGMSKALGLDTLEFASIEEDDYDCVTRHIRDNIVCYTPVQLKELVPARLNSQASLEGEIENLKKYTSSHELVVAVFINRSGQMELPPKIKIPPLPIAQLWLFGNLAADQSEWFLCGDILAKAECFKFLHPSFEQAT